MSPPGAVQCEIHVPISPTPGFFAQVQLLAASLRRNGGSLADASIVVTVSRDRPWFDIVARHPWADRYAIEWRWIEPALFEATGIFGTALRRFTYDFRAPLVVMLDADTLCTGPLDELAELGDGALAGLVAHAPPRWRRAGASRASLLRARVGDRLSPLARRAVGLGRHAPAGWQKLYAAANLPAPRLSCEHPGWGISVKDPRARRCPPYFNLGVLAGSRDVMNALGEHIFAELETVNRYLVSPFRCQLALTLALERTRIPWRVLPLRLNFPNFERYREAHPAEAADVRILHYLAQDEVDRARIATSSAELESFLSRRGLSPMNRLLQERVRALREELEPGLADVA